MRLAAAALLLLAACVRVPDPAALRGDWESVAAPARLELGERRWTLTSGAFVKSGVYQVSEDRIALLITDVNHAAFQTYCREEADVYEWEVQDRMLRFAPVGEYCDPVGETVLIAGPWEPA